MPGDVAGVFAREEHGDGADVIDAIADAADRLRRCHAFLELRVGFYQLSNARRICEGAKNVDVDAVTTPLAGCGFGDCANRFFGCTIR